MDSKDNNNLTVVDLFCGCGGFSLGMENAGFECLAAVDFNKEAIKVFQANFPQVPHVLQRDLVQFQPAELQQLIGTHVVDVIVGGPPCQGFSQARQVDGANHGSRLIEDPRRHLYRRFLAFVEHFKPKVFVMENVLGIRSASGGEYFTRVQAEGRALGYSVVAREEDATKLGVPQNRKRQLFIGVRLDVPGYLAGDLYPAPRAVPGATLGDAIMDLPALPSPGGAQEMDYDLERRARHTAGSKHHFIYRVLQVARATKLTAHESRRHSERDLRDFAKIKEGENSSQAMRERGIEFEYPYDKTSFKDRYTRQHRNRPCSTIVAHMSKDGLMFIHPTQQRSLTPREAARVQTFPDWFQFPVSRTHQYRVIGNAVPPLVGEAVGHTIASFLEAASALERSEYANVLPFQKAGISHRLPADTVQALEWLGMLACKTRHELRKLDANEFLQGWHALLYLYPGLHPDNALDHGEDEELVQAPCNTAVDLSRRYVRSGWPVSLELIGREAWRRFNENQIDENDFYCASAQKEGMRQGIGAGNTAQMLA